MTNYEWTRIIPMVLSVVAIIQLIIVFKKTHNYLVFAPMSWVILIFGYEVFKSIVDGDLAYYQPSVIINSFIFIQGLVMLITILFLYKDYTYSKTITPPSVEK